MPVSYVLNKNAMRLFLPSINQTTKIPRLFRLKNKMLLANIHFVSLCQLQCIHRLCFSEMAGTDREYTIAGIRNAQHMSLDSRDKTIYVGDGVGNIIRIDREGNYKGRPLASTSLPGDFMVHHTVRNAVLYYTYWIGQQSGIQKIKNADSPNEAKFDAAFEFNIEDTEKNKDGNSKKWKPISIHASSNSILVGMTRGKEGSVAICDLAGNLQQRIRWYDDSQDQLVYNCPHYITENVDGVICTSDSTKSAVMLVNPGNRTFTPLEYPNGISDPKGICTDTRRNVIVCFNKAVYMFDTKCTWHELLQKKTEYDPVSVCVDTDRFLYVGFNQNNIVKKFRYQ